MHDFKESTQVRVPVKQARLLWELDDEDLMEVLGNFCKPATALGKSHYVQLNYISMF